MGNGFQEQYTKKKDPYWLLLSFTMHHRAGLPIPKWALDIICDAFEKNVDEGESVDKTLGLRKKRPKFDRSKEQRNWLIFTFIYVLQEVYGMSVEDALTTIQFAEYPKDWAHVSREHLKNEYSKANYTPNIVCPNGDIAKIAEPLFKHAPEHLQRKYKKSNSFSSIQNHTK